MAIHNQKKKEEEWCFKESLNTRGGEKKIANAKNQMPGFGPTEENGRSRVELETSQNKDFKLDE